MAAGRGTRLGSAEKILLPLAGRPLLAYSIDAAEAARSIVDIIVVAGLHTKPSIERLVAGSRWRKVRHIALGGARRQDSVEAGLRLVGEHIDIVAVHDAARPLVTSDLFDSCIVAARETGGAIAAVPVTDTLKRVEGGRILGTLPREHTWAAQTPQAVELSLLRQAFAGAAASGREFTDEAGLLEALGITVTVVPSTPTNLKITRPDDLELAEALLAARLRGQAP